MFPPGREALLEDPATAEALRQVVAEGWTEEAKMFAQSALAAMSGHQPDVDRDQDQRHVMVSCEHASNLPSLVLSGPALTDCLRSQTSGTCRSWCGAS